MFMKYEHIIEERNYKYGPNEEFKTKEELKRFLRLKRGEIITKLSLEGYFKAVEVVEEEKKDSIRLGFIISYPTNLFED